MGNNERTQRNHDNCETICSQSAEARKFSCSLSVTQEQRGEEGEGKFTWEPSKFICPLHQIPNAMHEHKSLKLTEKLTDRTSVCTASAEEKGRSRLTPKHVPITTAIPECFASVVESTAGC